MYALFCGVPGCVIVPSSVRVDSRNVSTVKFAPGVGAPVVPDGEGAITAGELTGAPLVSPPPSKGAGDLFTGAGDVPTGDRDVLTGDRDVLTGVELNGVTDTGVELNGAIDTGAELNGAADTGVALITDGASVVGRSKMLVTLCSKGPWRWPRVTMASSVACGVRPEDRNLANGSQKDLNSSFLVSEFETISALPLTVTNKPRKSKVGTTTFIFPSCFRCGECKSNSTGFSSRNQCRSVLTISTFRPGVAGRPAVFIGEQGLCFLVNCDVPSSAKIIIFPS